MRVYICSSAPCADEFTVPGNNATTGEHNDVSDLSLFGAQLNLIKAIKATGTPVVVVFISGKPVAEPWIQESAFHSFRFHWATSHE